MATPLGILRRLGAALLVFGAIAPALERHGDARHLGPGSGAPAVVEAAALHAGAAPHVDASGERRRADACDLCARLAGSGVALPVSLTAAAAAPAALLVLGSPAEPPSAAASLGAPSGRAPPLG